MSDKTAEHLDRIKTSLDNAQAGLWDKHYGKGLSADYARAVDGDIRAALESLTALRASIEEMERQRKSWEAANQDVQCKLDCAWKTHNNYADKVERAIGKITEAEVDLPIPDIIAGRSAQVEALIVERDQAREEIDVYEEMAERRHAQQELADAAHHERIASLESRVWLDLSGSTHRAWPSSNRGAPMTDTQLEALTLKITAPIDFATMRDRRRGTEAILTALKSVRDASTGKPTVKPADDANWDSA